MQTVDMAADIREKALALGYEKCGIVPVEDMAGYGEKVARRTEEYPSDRPLLDRLAGLADIGKTHPWARSVLVLVRSYGKYKVPEHLRGRIASAYLFGSLHDERSREHAASGMFGDYLAQLGIRAETDRKTGIAPMRWAAHMAGLGLIRKNNFFYTESGSWVLLEAWLIDRAMTLTEKCALKPCPESCTRCVGACPTSALVRPYSTRPTACVSFMTGFGGDKLIDNPASRAMGGWIYGCDACQSACPFNRVSGRETAEYPGLDELAGQLSITNIIDMDYDELRNVLSERFWYISDDRLWKWKVNVLNAMKNDFKDEYLPWVKKACDDPAEQVRSMAVWTLRDTVRSE